MEILSALRRVAGGGMRAWGCQIMGEHPALGFGGLLRQLRAKAGLTQEELAQAASLSPRSVSDLERGINRTARQDTAELLVAALGVAEPVRALFVAAARGRAPAEDVLAALREAAAPEGPAWPGGPYLGLVPFEERDAQLFYGRDELTDQLVRRLAERLRGAGILLVAGESGSGKSSLLRAGLMPRLAVRKRAGAGVGAVAAAGDPAYRQPAAGAGDAPGRDGGRGSGVGVRFPFGGAG